MSSDSLDPREASIVRRLARFQQDLANGTAGPPSDGAGLDSAARRDLASCQRLLALLAETSDSIAGSEAAFPPAEETIRGDDPPARIGKFELLEECGRGGFGVVFRARDTILRRDVALKVPRREVVSSPALRERFLAEARTAAALSHSNLVSILEADQIGLLCYIAYAYCNGPSLAQWMRGRTAPVGVHAAASLIEQIARGVGRAHAAGICHRDIKPGNILLDTRGDEACDYPTASNLDDYLPKLTDFGLARWVQSPNPLSAAGQLVGTIRYMSPEQAEGKSAEVGPASDVYSLGVVFYELLAGRTPFAAESELQMLIQTLQADPPPLRQYRGDVPAALVVVCQKCLEKDPYRRYPNARELADDLRRFLDGTRIHAKGPGIARRAWRAARGRPVLSSAVVATLVAAAIGATEARRQFAFREVEETKRKAKAEIAKHEQQLEQSQYARQVRLAWRAWEQGEVQDAIARLTSLNPRKVPPDKRGFLWRLLWKRCWYEGDQVGTQEGPVYCAALDPTGRWLATGGGDRAVCLWDAETQRPIWRKSDHARDVGCIAFSPDGETIYSGGADRTVRRWTTTTGESEELTGIVQSTVEALAALPDGKRLAVAMESGDIVIWDLDRREQMLRWPGHRSEVNDLAVGLRGQLLASAGSDGLIQLWDVETGRCTGTLRGHNGSVTELAMFASDQVLASAGVDGTIRTWSMPEGTLRQTKQAHVERIDALAICETANLLVTSSKDGALKWWRADSLAPVAAVRSHARTWELVCDTAGRRLFSTREDGRIFSTSADGIPSTTSWATPKPHILASSPDGMSLAFAESAASVAVVSAGENLKGEGRRIATPQLDAVAFCRSGRSIAVEGAGDRCVYFRDIATGAPSGQYCSGTLLSGFLFAGPGEHRLVLIEFGANVMFVLDDSSDGRVVRKFGPFDAMIGATASRSGEAIALWKQIGTKEGEIEIWNSVLERKPIRILKTAGWSHWIQMSQDEAWLAVCLPPAKLLLWKLDSTSEAVTFSVPSAVSSLAFSPREPIIAVGCEDGAIRFYSIPDCELVATITAGSGPILSLVISPMGNWMSAGHATKPGAQPGAEGHVTYWSTRGLPLVP